MMLDTLSGPQLGLVSFVLMALVVLAAMPFTDAVLLGKDVRMAKILILLSFLLAVIAFAVVFALGMGFWPAFAVCWVVFSASLILLGLAAEGANLVGTVRRTR